MDQYAIRHAYISIFHEVMNDLKYLERRGGRVNVVLQKIMRHWLIALSPVIPHLCEEYWHRHVSESYVSLEILPAIPDGYPDESVLKAEEYVNRIIQDIREIMKATGIEPKSIQVSVVPDEIRAIFPSLAKGDMSKVPQDMKWTIPEFMKIRNLISQFDGDEYSILESSKEYLESTFGCKVSVSRGRPDRRNKNAWPGRPLIRLE